MGMKKMKTSLWNHQRLQWEESLGVVYLTGLLVAAMPEGCLGRVQIVTVTSLARKAMLTKLLLQAKSIVCTLSTILNCTCNTLIYKLRQIVRDVKITLPKVTHLESNRLGFKPVWVQFQVNFMVKTFIRLQADHLVLRK